MKNDIIQKIQFILAILTILGVEIISAQAPGTLDNSFSNDGKVTFNYRTTDLLRSVLVQPDGKILVFGNTKQSNGGNDFVIARFQSNGSTDQTFGSGGVRAIDLGANNEDFYEMQLQSDGKIIVVGKGFTPENYTAFAIIRLTANGSFDSGFGDGGVVYTVIGTSASGSSARSVAVQSNNKIVVTGGSGGGNLIKSATVRYNTNGNVDNTFNSGQPILTEMANYGGLPNKVIIQNDGKIVIAGYGNEQFSNDNPLTLIRYTSSGALDASFGASGKVKTLISNPSQTSKDESFGYSIAQQVDGKLIVCGYSVSGFSNVTLSALSNMFVARYNLNGTLDASFGNQGITLIPANGGTFNAAYSILSMANGKIILAGIEQLPDYSNLNIVRVNSDGTKDISFGGNGYFTEYLDNTTSDFNFVSAALQSDGKIVAAVSFNNNNNYDFMIVRLHNTESIAGIDETGINESIVIYPNPTENEITVKVKDKMAGTSYQILDVYGKLVKTGVLDSNYTSISLDDFAEGMYFIKTTNSSVLKFIKK